jgi:hypothetical protein
MLEDGSFSVAKRSSELISKELFMGVVMASSDFVNPWKF